MFKSNKKICGGMSVTLYTALLVDDLCEASFSR